MFESSTAFVMVAVTVLLTIFPDSSFVKTNTKKPLRDVLFLSGFDTFYFDVYFDTERSGTFILHLMQEVFLLLFQEF